MQLFQLINNEQKGYVIRTDHIAFYFTLFQFFRQPRAYTMAQILYSHALRHYRAHLLVIHRSMDKNNAESVKCIPNLFPTTAIMKGDSYAASTAVSGTTPRVVIVIQLTDKIPNTCTYRPISAVIMCETFEAGRPAFADLSAFAKMEYLPMWNFDAICSFYHSSESSSP